jgi:hypothetical protein
MAEKTQTQRVTVKRQHEIFSQIVRHLVAIVYLIAELVTGEKPESLTRGR